MRRINIAERKGDETGEYERMKNFLNEARSLVENHKERFLGYYTLAVKVWMHDAHRCRWGKDTARDEG